MVRTSAPERFLKPLRLKSLAIFRQSLDRTDEKDKNVLEFEEDCCILSMVFLVLSIWFDKKYYNTEHHPNHYYLYDF